MGIAVLVHLPLLLDDAGFFDGALLQNLADHGRFRELHRWFYNAGLSPEYWLHRTLWLLPAAAWVHRLVSFGAVVGIGAIVFVVANRYTALARRETFALACLVVVFPAYHIFVSILSIIYILPTFLLYLGWFLYFDGRIEDRGRSYRLVAYVLIFLSFVHNSLLVFHYAFACLAVWILVARGTRISAAVKRIWPVLVLPVAFQIVKVIWFQPRGIYAGYNRLVLLDGTTPLSHRVRMLGGGLLAYVGSPWLLALAPVAALVIWWLYRSRAITGLTAQVVLFGAGFCAAAIVPYLLVGKSPEPGLAWTDRYSMEAALGLALLALGAARIAGELLRRGASEGVVLALAWLWSVERLESHYFVWTTRAARDAAIVDRLRELSPPLPGTALAWRDDHPVGDETYRFYELGDKLDQAWGAQRWVAFDSRTTESVASRADLLTPKLRSGYLANDFVTNGCHGAVIITSNASDGIALRYLATFWSASRRAAIVHDLVTVQITDPTCP
ncbi:MAG: hypothetical protein ABJE66_05200 [Deltaproteobacteria bacterium]